MMSDNDIRKEFQSKLSGFEAPPPPDGWESIERSLGAALVARRALRRKWYAGGVAAALVLLIGSILFIRNPMEQSGTMVSEMVPAAPLTDSTPENDTEIAHASEFASNDPVVRTEKTGQQSASGISRTQKDRVKSNEEREPAVRPAAPGGMLAAWMKREKLQLNNVEKGVDAGVVRQSGKSIEKETEQNSEDLFEDEIIVIERDDELLFAEEERGRGTLLLAINGRGGMTGYQQRVNSPMTLRSLSAVPDKYMSAPNNNLQSQSGNVPNNVSEMEHDQPVSFGITVSKYLLDDLSIETGLVYSYLHSKSRNTNNNFKVNEVQKLHYLGIPLNVNYTVFSLNKLNIYASVGGMVEKDIHGEYRKIQEGQTEANFNTSAEASEEKEVTKISQSHPQVSVNVGVGLSYPIYDRLRLYGKIGGAYYFDAKNDYKTIYSDRKIVMDLNVGLRYEF